MTTDDERVYEEHVLPHFEQPYHRGSLKEATHEARVDNPVCGDMVSLSLQVADNVIEEAWQEGTGCIVSQAAASMLAQHVEDMSLEAVASFTSGDMLSLFGVRLTPHRSQCCLLAWQALRRAVALEQSD